MGNNYLRTMPGCPLCHSINVGWNQKTDIILHPNTIVENYICEDCGYSWTRTGHYTLTVYGETATDWYPDMKEN